MRDDGDELDLHAFLDGQLDPCQEALVLARLDADPDLRARMRAMAEQDLLVKIAAAEGALPMAAMRPMHQRLLQGVRRHAIWRRTGRIAAAIGLFILGWGARDASDHWLQTPLPGYAREALANHEVFAENRPTSVEAAGNSPDDLRRLLASQLGMAMEPPQLQSIGLRLIGARRAVTDDGPGSQLIYEDRQGHRITLLVAPSEDEPDAETLALTEAQGYVIGFWRGQHFGYALIGREPEGQLLQVADALGVPRE
ncbi:hypothetical protein GE253_07205 [Niveispirillum sp. SYP-B3756]|uniref:anti-sigma factor family protein n=1 Tax=Niveispirillum sp. SYP-B3756 TaxID=2662178 RepID=UPI0012909E2E|nr:hypothetical protein [Niveispirillum sp. SYP-B3756]MQP65134.1 hypothetical protein [Niveispirillum sp. SYP-B3756]